jgi:ABC-type Fe3+-hydroxamate transport system substrate-binding protein
MSVRMLRTLAALALAFLASAAHAQPFEVTDALGRRMRFDKPVERVAINFNFEEFTAVAGVEGWKKVVGMSRAPWESWRPANFVRYAAVIPNLASMPDIGNTDEGDFSAEKVIALRPDAFFLAEWMYTAIKDSRERIEAAGVRLVVIDYNAQTLERHLASTRAFGRIIGTEARAEELAKLYEDKYADIRARVAKATGPHPRVYIETSQGGADTTGITYNTTMWGRIFSILEADNVAAGRLPGASGQLNPEAVIAADPDVVFIIGSSWANRPKSVKTGYDATPDVTRASLAPYGRRAGWQALKAVRDGQIHAIEHGLARTLFDFVAMQYIAKQLYPAQFADVDPEAELRAYHARYLPVAYGGTWMLKLAP